VIKYISLFSGIEAGKIAFNKAGLDCNPTAFFEIEFLQGYFKDYTAGFSYSKRIDMLGNFWHVGTVAEIFRQIFA